MVQSVELRLQVPAELYHSLQGEINSLPKEEKTRLRSSPYPHSSGEVGQYVLEEYLLRRRNLPEDLSLEVEVEDSGKVIVVSEGGFLG